MVQRCENLVDLEKCCKTITPFSKSASIQPRRSPRKIGKQLQKLRFEHIDMEPAIQGSYYGDDDEDLTLGDAY